MPQGRKAKDFTALSHPDPVSDQPDPTSGTGDRPVLVADLDGTLLQSDMLHETFWASLSDRPKALFGAIRALSHGKPALKSYLAKKARLDVTLLPYDDRVLAKLAEWRKAGGRTALVTATETGLAKRIAAHLDLFDDVFGTEEDINLKGNAKADLLRDRYGPGNYIYIGDSAADLPVWRDAAQAISLGAPNAVRRQLDQSPTPAEHWPAQHDPMRALIRAMRPHQWLKNILVFVPLAAGRDFSLDAILLTCIACLALSLTASAGYVVNDLLDLRDDRSHPRKRDRPLASGALSARIGTFAAPGLLLLGLALGTLVSPLLGAVVLIYFISTMAYSLSLKRHTMLDICILAFLFTLRIIAGAMAIAAPLSVWLLAFSMFIFLSLAAVKRLAELSDAASAGRLMSRRGYRAEDRAVISQIVISSGYLAVLVLALYVNEPVVRQNFSTPWLLWGICPFLIFWVSRLALVASRGDLHDDPLIWAMRNKTSQKVAIVIFWIIVGAMVL